VGAVTVAAVESVVARMQAITTACTVGPPVVGGQFATLLGGAGGVLGTTAAEQVVRGDGAPAQDPFSGSALAHRLGNAASPGGSAILGATGVPVDLAGYGNGLIPPEVLTPIGQGDHRLWRPAATAFMDMAAAAARDGVAILVSDSYRDLAAQQRLAAELGLYSEGGLAAEPGTSDHGWGRAVDIDDNQAAVAWLRAHAHEYGFRENVPREPWHWTYLP
jgi:hypothetical protein